MNKREDTYKTVQILRRPIRMDLLPSGEYHQKENVPRDRASPEAVADQLTWSMPRGKDMSQRMDVWRWRIEESRSRNAVSLFWDGMDGWGQFCPETRSGVSASRAYGGAMLNACFYSVPGKGADYG